MTVESAIVVPGIGRHISIYIYTYMYIHRIYVYKHVYTHTYTPKKDLKSPLEVNYLQKNILVLSIQKFLLFLVDILEMAAILKNYAIGP